MAMVHGAYPCQVKRNDTGNILSITKTDTVGSDTFTFFRQYGTQKTTKREKGVKFKRVSLLH